MMADLMEYFGIEDSRVLIGIITAIVIFIIEIVLLKKDIILSGKKRDWKRLKNLGMW